MKDGPRVVALCGGVGGAKLALGLAAVIPGANLTLVVNTGDDFGHLGLHISPDIDTVLYTLAGVVNPEQGWGRAEESWSFMEELARLGGETWFRLGDRDLAMHVERTRALASGEPLSSFTARAAQRFGLQCRLLPMSDQPVRTIVETHDGVLAFQRYFVERRCAPVLREVRFQGAGEARPAPGVEAALTDPSLDAIVICPSNPYLSIDPMLSIPGIRACLEASPAVRVAVSPIIGGGAVKGPTRKIMDELGIRADNRSIAEHYRYLLDGLVIDAGDADDAGMIDLPVLSTPTLMTTEADKRRLAEDVVSFARTLAGERARRPTAGGSVR